MCDYAKNIEAAKAVDWVPGTVVMHHESGNIYTITADEKFFSHGDKTLLGYTTTKDYDRATRRKSFTILS